MHVQWFCACFVAENMESKIILKRVANVLILLAINVSKAYTSCLFLLSRPTLFVPTLNLLFMLVDNFSAKIWVFVRERCVLRFTCLLAIVTGLCPSSVVVRRPSCVVRKLFYLNIFFSVTAYWILTKLHRNDPWVVPYQSCSNCSSWLHK